MSSENPMSRPDPWSLVAEGYVTDTRPVFGQYCEEAVKLSGLSHADRVLDVACGPGTLSLRIHHNVKEIDAIDFSQGMLDCFNRDIADQGISNIRTHLMDGQQLEFEDNSFDFAFSIFGLMFFPDRMKGFSEVYRTLKPGGCAVVSSWAPVAESSAMTLMFGAIQKAFPRKSEADNEKILNLEDPDNFRHEMEHGGFTNVSVTPFDGYWDISSTRDFYDSMERGSAPIAMMKNRMSPEDWAVKREIMVTHINEQVPELPARLNARAFIARGYKT